HERVGQPHPRPEVRLGQHSNLALYRKAVRRMTTTITTGTDRIRPLLAELASYGAAASSRNVVHDILDGPPVVTLRDATPDTGELSLVFASEQDGLDALEVHKLAAVFTITDTDRAALNFRYVLDGTATLELDRDTVNHWRVRI